jgi:hypothetical protein
VIERRISRLEGCGGRRDSVAWRMFLIVAFFRQRRDDAVTRAPMLGAQTPEAKFLSLMLALKLAACNFGPRVNVTRNI